MINENKEENIVPKRRLSSNWNRTIRQRVVEGVLEVLMDECFCSENYLPGTKDIYISLSIRSLLKDRGLS